MFIGEAWDSVFLLAQVLSFACAQWKDDHAEAVTVMDCVTCEMMHGEKKQK